MAVQKVLKGGRVVWRARLKIDGTRRTAFRRTRAEAIEAEAELRMESPTRGGEEAPTLAGMWPDFVEFQNSNANKRPNRPRTAKLNAALWRLYIEPELGELRVDAITTRHVDRLAARMEGGHVGTSGRELKRNTVANALGLLRRMLRVAKRWGYVETLPEIDAQKRRSDRLDDDQWLTKAEASRLVEHAEPRWRPVFVVAIRTGLRMGELRGLRWQDVDLEGRRLHVRQTFDDRVGFGPPKSGKPREVPLSWDAAEVLASMKRGKRGALVFGDASGLPFHRNAWARSLERMADAAELAKHVNPHMTRHTWASHCVAEGIPTRVLMLWGGWTTEAMLGRYAHLSPREVDHLVDRIAPVGSLRVVDGRAEGAPQGAPNAKTAS